MLRVRFNVTDGDYRPVSWPIKHPYWCTGHTLNDNPILVAYVDSLDEIVELWPDAENICIIEKTDTYTFTDRFPKPSWLQ